MSVRVVTRLFKHATNLVRIQCKRNLGTTNITEKINAAQQVTQQPARAFSNQVVPRNFGLRNVGIQLGIQARKILIDNVLSRVTNSLASELRKKAAKRYCNLFYYLFIICQPKFNLEYDLLRSKSTLSVFFIQNV